MRALALASFGVYAIWNLAFIASFQIPPSIWTSLTGLPCPTTGGTHAVLAALRGEWRSSVTWNPFAFPFVALVFLSIASITVSAIRHRPAALPRWMVVSWAVCLGVAWVWKLATIS